MKNRNRKSLPQQCINLQKHFPNGKCLIEREQLKWKGCVQPTAFSRKYNLLLIYKLTKSPRVWVVDPPVEEDAPHRYKEKNLCLNRAFWKPEDLLCDTIIPWACLWLFFYEEWCVSRVWKGGGDHPGKKKEPFIKK